MCFTSYLNLITYVNLGIEDISGFSMGVHEHVSSWRYDRKMQFLSTVIKKDAENIYLNYLFSKWTKRNTFILKYIKHAEPVRV